MDNSPTPAGPSPQPRGKAELLERVREARANLDEFLESLAEAQLVWRSVPDGWSIKDHLVHLAAWERGIAALLEQRPRWAAMGLDPIPGDSTDDVNERIYQRNKDLSLPEAAADFRAAQREMDEALARLTDADLLRTYSYYQPQEPGTDSGRPVIAWIAGNTYEHYDEHLEWLKALVAGLE